MSKAEKMQKRLANLAKEREDFERQKQQLEMEMDIGKKNMGKIQKSLKSHLHDIEVLDTETVVSDTNSFLNQSRGPSRRASKAGNGRGSTYGGGNNNSANANNNSSFHGANSSSINGMSFGASTSGAGSPNPRDSIVDKSNELSSPMPTGPRITDWSYTAPLDSTPPVVKSRELYENVRLLGRGSFGEVSLVKNIEDHKL
jgi:transglutaminase/protease-like cytokinesis protein 3